MLKGVSEVLAWLSENVGNIVICLILAGIVVSILIHLFHKKKSGCSSCGGSCGGCAMNGACHGGSQGPKPD